MLRSLYTGISGLGANAVELDVISNNIANANTIGYKASRVTFSEMMSQNLRPGSRPVAGGRGGVNPQQIGMGTQVGSIDTLFGQGTLQSTGVMTDLAIQGDGFFVLSDGASSFYTRAGAFGVDGGNFMVDPATGMRVQGLMADADGVIPASGTFSDIFIDPSLTVPAQASTSVELYGNLDADADAMASIRESGHMMAAADLTDRLTEMYAQSGASLGLADGDLITLSGMIESAAGTDQLAGAVFEVGSTVPGAGGSTVAELMAWIEAQLDADPALNPGDVTLSLEADGSLSLVNNSGGATLRNLQLSIGGNTAFNESFQFTSSVAPGASGSTYDAAGSDGQLRAAATTDDLLTEVFNFRGESLGLNVSATNPATTLQLGGTVGGSSINEYALSVDAGTTVQDLLTGLQAAFGLATNPVALDESGQIVMTGEIGTDYALGDVRISEQGESNPVLDTSFNFTQTQEARDAETFTLATPVYDSLGGMHTIQIEFSRVTGRNEWRWEAQMEGVEELLSGGSGTVTFDETGAVTSLQYDDGASGLSFRPQAVGAEGAEDVTVQLEVGQSGTMNGLTQFTGAGNLRGQADGYGVGQIIDFHIDQAGVIVGHFSNDTVRDIARIGIARFANPAGLSQAEGNTWKMGSNSGAVMNGFAADDNGNTITAGALESSNVDLAEQFTRLVVAQRAFQANSRVITTGDQVLQELVSILR